MYVCVIEIFYIQTVKIIRYQKFNNIFIFVKRHRITYVCFGLVSSRNIKHFKFNRRGTLFLFINFVNHYSCSILLYFYRQFLNIFYLLWLMFLVEAFYEAWKQSENYYAVQRSKNKNITRKKWRILNYRSSQVPFFVIIIKSLKCLIL